MAKPKMLVYFQSYPERSSVWMCGDSIVHRAHKRAAKTAAGSQLGFQAEAVCIQTRHAVGSAHTTSALPDRQGLGADPAHVDKASKKVTKGVTTISHEWGSVRQHRHIH